MDSQPGDLAPGSRTSAARLALLTRAGELLSGSHAGDARLDRLARLLVPALGTWSAIDVLEDGGLRRCAECGRADAPVAADAPRGPAIAVRTGEAQLGEAAGTPLLCVPMLAHGRALGAITLLGGGPYEPDDVELACELANRAAEAVETAALHRSLERSEERYRLLFDQSPLPMWVYDVETLAFLAVNDAAIRHYGYSREEFLAMRITDIRRSEEVPTLLENLRREGSGSPLPRTWKHRRSDGSMIDVEITAGRVTFDGRDAALILANDVSERRRLEQRLVEAERLEAIGRLAGGVAHDFNNLLTVIHGYASVLLARDDAPAEELAEIVRATEQAAALTRQMLAFGRRQVMHTRVLDLNEIVAAMQSMLQRIIGDDVSVGVRFGQGLAAVEADRAQLERVILNLAANARDAMPDGGRLTIETANVELDQDYVDTHGEGTPGPHVMLAISDTGTGMTEEVRNHLFEPFFTTKPAGAGSGLGLATVFGVVKQSGGSIYLYSEEGRGTTFKIYLPAVAATAERSAPAGDAPATAGSETVVVVEDDERVRDLVRIMLDGAGYEVIVAEDAAEAERVCAQRGGEIDLVITDVVMPDMSGRELADRLARVSPGTRILFMSGYSDEAVHHGGVIRPDSAFIEKPFSARTLTRKVRETLDAPRASLADQRW
jgi:PAS domain S-box-containing protein